MEFGSGKELLTPFFFFFPSPCSLFSPIIGNEQIAFAIQKVEILNIPSPGKHTCSNDKGLQRREWLQFPREIPLNGLLNGTLHQLVLSSSCLDTCTEKVQYSPVRIPT